MWQPNDRCFMRTRLADFCMYHHTSNSKMCHNRHTIGIQKKKLFNDLVDTGMEQGLVCTKDKKWRDFKPKAPPTFKQNCYHSSCCAANKTSKTEQSWPTGSGYKNYLKINMAGMQAKSKNTMVAQVSTSHLKRKTH